MRSLLGVLREGGGEEYAPQPDVAAIPALVEDVRASGLDVDLIVEGEPQAAARRARSWPPTGSCRSR